jgi:hypothetical protein
VVITRVLRITDSIRSKSTVSEFSIKSKGKDEEGSDDDAADDIFYYSRT